MCCDAVDYPVYVVPLLKQVYGALIPAEPAPSLLPVKTGISHD